MKLLAQAALEAHADGREGELHLAGVGLGLGEQAQGSQDLRRGGFTGAELRVELLELLERVRLVAGGLRVADAGDRLLPIEALRELGVCGQPELGELLSGRGVGRVGH